MKNKYIPVSDSDTLAQINKPIRAFLDRTDNRGLIDGKKPTVYSDIECYLERMFYCRGILESSDPDKEHQYYLLPGGNDKVDYEGIKFQYSFALEALVWYIRRESRCEVQEEEKRKQKAQEAEKAKKEMETKMGLYEEIKERITVCMKEGNTQERDVLRTLVGEVQSKSVGQGKDITDELVIKTLTSFKENAQECMKYAHQDDPNEAVDSIESSYEIEIYDKFLPQYATVEEIVEMLTPQAEQLKSAKADGPATGMAMGMLKKSGANVQGKDVAEAVKRIRQ